MITNESFKFIPHGDFECEVFGLIQVWTSTEYLVRMRTTKNYLHLMICRHDRARIKEWYTLQEIKNQIVGREKMAFEVYPPMEDLIDCGNVSHLWAPHCLSEPLTNLYYTSKEAHELKGKIYDRLIAVTAPGEGHLRGTWPSQEEVRPGKDGRTDEIDHQDRRPDPASGHDETPRRQEQAGGR